MSTDERHLSSYHQPVRQPKPGDLLFEFYVERTKTFYRVELRDHGGYGVEAQFFEAPNRLHRAPLLFGHGRYFASVRLHGIHQDMPLGFSERPAKGPQYQ